VYRFRYSFPWWLRLGLCKLRAEARDNLRIGEGGTMTVTLGVPSWIGSKLLDADPWLALWLFAGGWALQFVGHIFEGRRPAFFKNATHLLVGPIYIMSRALGRR
jgi:uncharacterized membrane protein YGL010W